MDHDWVLAVLHEIRLRIDRCVRDERADRQMALEDVDGMVSNLTGEICKVAQP
jgi:hypothetical protein